jgi:hypothetical protein
MKISDLRSLIKEEIKQIISERFLNLFKKEQIQPYIQDIWNIMRRTYEPIGEFKTASTPEELLDKIGFAKLVRKDNKIIAALLYSDKYGRKAVAGGSDGTPEDVKAVKQIFMEDIKFDRSWGEFSGKTEQLLLKYGGVPIPNDFAEEILGKEIISKNKNGFHYTRMIGGKPFEKILIGNPKK